MKNLCLVTALIVALAFIGTACGKKEAGPSGSAPAAATASPAVPAAVAETSPAENLGKKIGSSYIETLKQVVAVLKDKPAPADAKAMLADMKAWTIELMVGLGKEREALPVADRAVVDRVTRERLAINVPAELFKEYQDGMAFYSSDAELHKLIGEFNIITQYAFFDLLKKQLPEEAKRLGIQ